MTAIRSFAQFTALLTAGCCMGVGAAAILNLILS